MIGPGGVGKTRLASQLAAELIDSFQDGVFFVPLASIQDAALLSSTISAALSIPELGNLTTDESLKEQLSGRELLLVLDNFEQIVEAAPLVADLLKACRRLKILVTSRQVLRIEGESVYTLDTLPCPLPIL